jgi:hypothetical protein
LGSVFPVSPIINVYSGVKFNVPLCFGCCNYSRSRNLEMVFEFELERH